MSAADNKACEVCFFSAWEPTPEGERCAFCWLEEEYRKLDEKHKDQLDANLRLVEEIDGMKKRVKVERQMADGYARSASLEFRDKLEEEIHNLKKQLDRSEREKIAADLRLRELETLVQEYEQAQRDEYLPYESE